MQTGNPDLRKLLRVLYSNLNSACKTYGATSPEAIEARNKYLFMKKLRDEDEECTSNLLEKFKRVIE